MIRRFLSPFGSTQGVTRATTTTLGALLGLAMLFAVSSFAATTDAATSATARTDAPAATTAPSVDACKQGQSLEELGRYDEAVKAYIGALAKPETQSCAKAALSRLEVGGLTCASAEALKSVHLDSEARAAFRKQLEAVPTSACAATGVKRTRGKHFWSWMSKAAEDLGGAVGAVAVAGLVLALAGWILVAVGTHLPVVRHFWPFRRFRQVRVRVSKLDDSAVAPTAFGESATGSLRARLGADPRVDQLAGVASSADALDGLAEASSQAKIVVAVIKLLKGWLPARDWVVAGHLHAEGDDGVGLSLAIENRGSFVDFGSFWAKSVAGPSPGKASEAFQRLTVPAAGWLGHHISTANSPRDRLTTDAPSWALTRCALYWYDRGNRPEAREFYSRALGEDGNNIAALANLGIMDAEDGDVAEALERLTTAIELLEQQ
jgi:tetratricopeptide (TPR) repeat protein